MINFFKKKENNKTEENIGFYDTKPFHYFSSALIYAKEVLLKEVGENKIYARVYNNSLFVFCLIADEKGYNENDYCLESLEMLVNDKIDEKYKNTIHIIIFKNKNDFTINVAKEKVINTKNSLKHVLIYNEEKVGLEFYRPVPEFYKIYENYAVAIFFDLAAIDPTRY